MTNGSEAPRVSPCAPCGPRLPSPLSVDDIHFAMLGAEDKIEI